MSFSVEHPSGPIERQEYPVVRPRPFLAAIAEFSGTCLLVAVVVGSGIMGSTLSSDLGVALLINASATVLALALLINVLAPVSGAHFNPAVSLVEAFAARLPRRTLALYLFAQTTGAIVGAMVANFMFDQPMLQTSTKARATLGTFASEVIATSGLIALIGILQARKQSSLAPLAVAGWIGSAYFFTSSTSFANPAVTVGRIFSDSFAGIAPASAAPFVVAQLIGAALGAAAAITINNATPNPEETYARL